MLTINELINVLGFFLTSFGVGYAMGCNHKDTKNNRFRGIDTVIFYN